MASNANAAQGVYWEQLESGLLLNVLQLLPFKAKLRCERTCKGWRSVLRHYALAKAYGEELVILDSQDLSVGDVMNADMVIARNLPRNQASLIKWLVQRPGCFETIALGTRGHPIGVKLDLWRDLLSCISPGWGTPNLKVSIAGKI